MKKLEGKVALVAGASRGAGRGIAVALGAPGTVEDTAEEVTARGGQGIAVRADLSDAGQAAALFQRVEEEHGRLDVLANSAWSPNCMPFWGKPFWDLTADL